jgi:ribosomal protein L29
MKKSKRNELRVKDVENLQQHLKLAREKRAQVRFDIQSGKTKACSEDRVLRSEIATIMTLIQEKETKNHD